MKLLNLNVFKLNYNLYMDPITTPIKKCLDIYDLVISIFREFCIRFINFREELLCNFVLDYKYN